MFDFVLKGANASQLEKDIGTDLFPANEHFFGLVNVSIYSWLPGVDILPKYMKLCPYDTTKLFPVKKRRAELHLLERMGAK